MNENRVLLPARAVSAKRSFASISVARWLVLACALGRPATIAAQTTDDQQRPPTWTIGSGTTLTLFPSGDVYPLYTADPYRPTTSVTGMPYTRARIEGTGSPRIGLAAGGRFGVLRIEPASAEGRSWQVSLNAGLNGLFDAENRADAVGWDGNYGLALTTAARGPLAVKIAMQHVSGHLGDEYADRTGLTRINYDRNEIALGLSLRLTRGWRTYGEAGAGYKNRYEEQKPWRGQAGVEYESRPTIWGGRFAWYAATDFSAMEERDWRLDTSIQGGILTRANGHTYRLVAGWTDGRPPLTEFFRLSERWFTFGLHIDL